MKKLRKFLVFLVEILHMKKYIINITVLIFHLLHISKQAEIL